MHLLYTTRTAYFFDFRAVSYIFVVCSNGVEQSRFWCRADFLSRWISSRWPFSISMCAKTVRICVCGHHALHSRMNHLIEEKPFGIFRRKRRFNMRTNFPLKIFGRFIFIIRSYTFWILMESLSVQNVTKNT